MSVRRLALVLALCLVLAAAAVPNAAAPLSCDSELQSFVTPGMVVATTSKYAIEKTDPNQPLPDPDALEFMLWQALDAVTLKVRALTDAPSANANVIQQQYIGGTTWEVAGESICVDEGAYGGAVIVYAPVVSTSDDGLTGFLPEGVHWKNATPQQFIPGDINAISAGNTVVIKRLSFYMLEPAKLNPHIPPLDDFNLAANVAEPACDGGAPTFLDDDSEAQSLWRTDAKPMTQTDFQILQNVGNFHMVFFDPSPLNSLQNVDKNFIAYYLYAQAIYENQQINVPLIKPGMQVEIIDGPLCQLVESVTATQLETYNPFEQYEDLFPDLFPSPDDTYRLAVGRDIATFWKIRATIQNTIVEGWALESLALDSTVYLWDMSMDIVDEDSYTYDMDAIRDLPVESHFDANYYWLSPLDLGTENAAYQQGWELNRDIVVGEPSVRYDPYDPFGLTSPLPGGDCPTLPSRLTSFGGARVIIPTLNVRTAPSPSAQVVAGAGQGTIFRLGTAPVCLGGYRWWPVSVDQFGTPKSGWAAENDSAVYYLEPAIVSGLGSFNARPTDMPTAAPTSTPAPQQPTAEPTRRPRPTATPTDPIPG